MVTGSPGGSRIILYVLKSLICVIDWGFDAQKAASLTNFGSRNGPFEVEIGAEGSWIGLRMHLRGHAIKTSDMTSGLHIIVRREGRMHGGADPRRDGVAIGD
jgi:gamma-glutamyltranspeptidase/glutathione hydrolase